MKVDELGEEEGAGPVQTTTISSVKVDQPVGQSASDADLIVCYYFFYSLCTGILKFFYSIYFIFFLLFLQL